MSTISRCGKGHVYGTVLIDIDTRRPVDVLAERSSERDLRTLLGIVRGTRDDLPQAGLPLSLLAELTDHVRCDNVSVFSENYCAATAAEEFM